MVRCTAYADYRDTTPGWPWLLRVPGTLIVVMARTLQEGRGLVAMHLAAARGLPVREVVVDVVTTWAYRAA